jgi:D-glycero-alpha-D-manno-heptose 1-phosphate guanylyltransferase
MSEIAKNLSDATAVILAGGVGTRLRSMVPDRPKVLAQVRGRPFLTYLLDQLADFGIRRVVLCTGWMGDLVRSTLGDAYGEIRLTYSHEASPSGTAGALRLAFPLFDTYPLLVMNGDSICRADLQAFWMWHGARDAQGTLLLAQVSDVGRYGSVRMSEEDVVLGFEEKGETGPGWINAGIYLLTRAFVEAIPAEGPVSLEHEVFPVWVGRGLFGYRSGAVQFLDIGTPASYARAAQFFDSGCT